MVGAKILLRQWKKRVVIARAKVRGCMRVVTRFTIYEIIALRYVNPLGVSSAVYEAILFFPARRCSHFMTDIHSSLMGYSTNCMYFYFRKQLNLKHLLVLCRVFVYVKDN